MNSLVLAALAAVSAPSDADTEAMFDRSDAFVRVCQPALVGLDNPAQPEEQAAIGLACISFVTGVSYAKHAADNYTVKGEVVCSGLVSARQTMDAAFRIYHEVPMGKQLTPLELILAGQMGVSPCR